MRPFFGTGGGVGGSTGGGGSVGLAEVQVWVQTPCSKETRAQLTTVPGPVGASTITISRRVPHSKVPSSQRSSLPTTWAAGSERTYVAFFGSVFLTVT